MFIFEMPKKKPLASTKSVRLLQEISDAIDAYAEQELVSANAAINRLLRDALVQKGFLTEGDKLTGEK
ncbi:MAG: hypothetical protein HWQ38_07890 [Nostoc sp. NMS7]|uniref:hypothetical protein n=1 Tax=Nostoc sp. NMS7 TaxID=2815391 RepID=UPI0025DE9FDD|nr:hypothetical protein [Nostoc sp. NMS7]MBN3946403.1 hypothetical protein [Nostoc sp. NMS7]